MADTVRARRSSSSSSASSSSAPFTPPPYLPSPDAYPGRPRSLAGIALRAFCLGAVAATGLVLVPLLAWSSACPDSLRPLWRLPFFLGALAVFHFLEFWTTAAYNTPAATVGSFLLTANWPAYAVAHAVACLECLARWAWGGYDRSISLGSFGLGSHTLGVLGLPLGLLVGAPLVLLGQAVRSAAMVQAGRSFNHTIQRQRAQSHTLVTTGIYAHLRHPSYFGFFWWALGTQLVLGNTLSLAGYAAVLWRFFALRIRHEETLLERFFGAEYVAYRARVGTKMPFIG